MCRFYFSVSTEPYNRNIDEGSESKIEWTEEKGTVEDLITFIKDEYAFCPTFHHNQFTFANSLKKNENLKATYFIAFDFDAVKTEAGDFYDMMMSTDIPPTIVYTTCNNGKRKKPTDKYFNRYRVVWVLDEPITTSEEYTALHIALKNEVASITGDDYSDETTDKSVSHFYAGCSCADVWYNDTVTPLKWIEERYEYCSGSFFGGVVTPTNSPEKNPPSRSYIEEKSNNHSSGDFSEFIRDYGKSTNTFGMLMQKYKYELDLLPLSSDITPYINESNKHKLYIDVDDNYMKIKLPNPYKRIKDGQHRKAKIFYHCLELRLITPDATYEELLWSALWFMYHYIDNTEDPINRTLLKKKVNEALSEDIDSGKWERLRQRLIQKFVVNREEAANRYISSKTAPLVANVERLKEKKNEKWELMLKWYDPDLKDKENIAILKEKEGLDVSEKYYYKFKKANGLTRKNKSEPKPYSDITEHSQIVSEPQGSVLSAFNGSGGIVYRFGDLMHLEAIYGA